MKKFIIGADEAGRGCIAGSIFACAATIINKDNIKQHFCDSKKLSKEKRNNILLSIIESYKNNDLDFVIVSKDSKYIDKYGLGLANKNIFIESIDKLINKLYNKYGKEIEIEVIIDGNLKLFSNEFKKIEFKSIIKADDTFQEVSLASIMAKTSKDNEMRKLDELYNQYGFINHSGYDTKEHRDNLYKYGFIKDIHRESTKTLKDYKLTKI